MTITTLCVQQEKAQDAGKIGSVIMGSGMISSLIFGYILDKTRCFKFVPIISNFIRHF